MRNQQVRQALAYSTFAHLFTPYKKNKIDTRKLSNDEIKFLSTCCFLLNKHYNSMGDM